MKELKLILLIFLLANSESDSGLYTAKASNGVESALCSAQLIVHESKYKGLTENFVRKTLSQDLLWGLDIRSEKNWKIFWKFSRSSGKC